MRLQLIATTAIALVMGTVRVSFAQFTGDVYFETPSVSVPAGQEAVLNVALFSGSDVVGATDYSVAYNPTQLELLGVEEGASALQVVSLRQSDSVGIVNLNGTALNQPIGTVGLAQIRFRALAQPGTRSAVAITVRKLLKADNTAFSQKRGFSGEVVITGPAPVVASMSQVDKSRPVEVVGAASALGRRALSLRRPGQVVELRDPAPRLVLVREYGGD